MQVQVERLQWQRPSRMLSAACWCYGLLQLNKYVCWCAAPTRAHVQQPHPPCAAASQVFGPYAASTIAERLLGCIRDCLDTLDKLLDKHQPDLEQVSACLWLCVCVCGGGEVQVLADRSSRDPAVPLAG